MVEEKVENIAPDTDVIIEHRTINNEDRKPLVSRVGARSSKNLSSFPDLSAIKLNSNEDLRDDLSNLFYTYFKVKNSIKY